MYHLDHSLPQTSHEIYCLGFRDHGPLGTVLKVLV